MTEIGPEFILPYSHPERGGHGARISHIKLLDVVTSKGTFLAQTTYSGV
jgi:hypothetical protein